MLDKVAEKAWEATGKVLSINRRLDELEVTLLRAGISVLPPAPSE